ncbi:MAG: hypothetical protein RL701_5627 [Pseudomonadota bacterium]|jgi:serine/threonine protein kinase
MTPEGPHRIGSYLLRSVIGRGGMGVVYQAVHDVTKRTVALKTVRLARSGRLSQLRRETQALARLDHPGIVRVIEHGVDGDVPWYAMELLGGRTLTGAIKAVFTDDVSDAESSTIPTLDSDLQLALTSTFQPSIERADKASYLPAHVAPAVAMPIRSRLPELLGIAQRLCEILEYVHGEGIVHRDIKPSNVFVTDTGRPVLVDFGLAKRLGDAGGREVIDADALTGGSARYMAPEQIRGEMLDPRCDLYSLGCVLFELVSGRPPFMGSAREVIEQHLRRPPPKLSELMLGVPPAVETLVARLLAKDRRERIGYARDVASALAHWPGPRWSRAVPRAKTYLYRSPLVGRRDILTSFEHAQHALHQRSGRLGIVHGESGVGKTRLALELAQLGQGVDLRVIASGGGSGVAGSGVTAATARTTPLEHFRPFLCAVADACIEGGAAETTRLLGASSQLLAAYEPTLANLLGQHENLETQWPAAVARERLCHSLLEVLTAFVATTPLMLILDDLQWADEHTLGFLRYLASGHIRNLPVLVLGLVRSEERGPVLADIQNQPDVLNVELGRLPPHEVARMVAGMLSLDEAAPDFVRFLSDKSEGNAFFVTEYLRIAVAEQVLVRNDSGQWSLAQSTEPTSVLCESLPLPWSLREVVERRLAGLTPSTHGVMLLAATIGRQFELTVLQQAAAVSDAAALDAVTDLVQRQIIEPLEDAPGFRFTHDKMREIPYASFATQARATAHRSVASALEWHVAQGHPVEPSELGHHWFEAGEAGLSVSYFRAAADRAMQLSALDRAILHYRAAERALCSAADASAGGELAAIREGLGDALCLVGSLAPSKDAFELALTAQPSLLTGLVRARLARKIGKTCELAHQHEQALTAYDVAEQTLLALDNHHDRGWVSEWIRTQRARIWIYYWLARITEMNASVERLAPYIDSQASALDRSDYYHALASSSYRSHRYQVPGSAIEYARRSLEAAQQANAPLEAAFVRFTLGFGLLFCGQLEAAEVELSDARAASRRLGHAMNEVRCLAYLTLTHRRAQRVEDTRQLALETLERARVANMLDYLGLAQASLGWAAWKQGDLPHAQEFTQAALASWSTLSFEYPFQWAGVLTGLVLQLERVPLRALIVLAEKLLDARLARLPQTIERSLAESVRHYEEGRQAETREQLQKAIRSASREGFL